MRRDKKGPGGKMREKNELALGSTLTSRLLLTSEIFARLPACPVSSPFPLSKGFHAGGPPTFLPPSFLFLLSQWKHALLPSPMKRKERALLGVQHLEPCLSTVSMLREDGWAVEAPRHCPSAAGLQVLGGQG